MSALIYAGVFRGRGVLAQYYTRRETNDYESLARETGSELVSRTEYSNSIKETNLLGKIVLSTARRVKGEGVAFILIAETAAKSRGEEALKSLAAICVKDLESLPPPVNPQCSLV